MSHESRAAEQIDDGLPLSRPAGWIVVHRAVDTQHDALLQVAGGPDRVEEAMIIAKQCMMLVIEHQPPTNETYLPEHEMLFQTALQMTAQCHQDEMTRREAQDVLESNFLGLEAIEFEPGDV